MLQIIYKMILILESTTMCDSFEINTNALKTETQFKKLVSVSFYWFEVLFYQ